jgi:hypothetical protein
MTNKADTLRAELINLRACQNAPSYDYDGTVERRILAVQLSLRQLAKRRAYASAHRSLMYDLNGHHGPA